MGARFCVCWVPLEPHVISFEPFTDTGDQSTLALLPLLPKSPYEALEPAYCWFPADEALRASSYERLLPPLVAQVRAEVRQFQPVEAT